MCFQCLLCKRNEHMTKRLKKFIAFHTFQKSVLNKCTKKITQTIFLMFLFIYNQMCKRQKLESCQKICTFSWKIIFMNHKFCLHILINVLINATTRMNIELPPLLHHWDKDMKTRGPPYLLH